MCGIFATFSTESIEDMNYYFKLLKHRGPDSSSIMYIDQLHSYNVIFGFHRLSIIDPTEHSMQPLILDDLYLICNGEIFNHNILKEKYNFNMNTGSDCEIILHLYNHFNRGQDALNRLLNEIDAEFAFVLYDKTNKVLMCARDPFGVRPLFYNHDKNNVYISSELKALTFKQHSEQFLPGMYMYKEYNKNILLTRYYQINNNKIYPEPSLDTIHTTINNIIHMSVEKRLMSDRQIGCFLSGGVDSSLITAIVSKYLPNVQCFSIGLDGGLDIDFAKIVVKHLNDQGKNIKHHIVNFTIEQGLKAIRNVIWHLETYDITTIRASIPQYLLSEYISKNTNVRVLYSGEGSDEIFNSYLYSRLAPSCVELENDSKRLLEELYMFDNLRVDRTTAAFGLEVRIPFLDPQLINYMFSLNPELRSCKTVIEKKLLRDAFNDKTVSLLPETILYRKKEAFSDAVSSKHTSWYKSISEHIDIIISDEEFSNDTSSCPNKEALYYKMIFDELFPNQSNILKHYWMPKWTDTNGDPSATVLNCYNNII